jgi:hypothetical protein
MSCQHTCMLLLTLILNKAQVVDVFPPRHIARPFHHIRSSIACLHPPHPPITRAPAASPPAVRATSFAPAPGPSFSPPLLRPPLLPLHSTANCTASCRAKHTTLPARVRGGPREHQRRARSDDEVPWSPSTIDYRYSVLACDRVDNRYDTRIRVVYQYTSIQRPLSFVPLTPELTIYFCSTASTLL